MKILFVVAQLGPGGQERQLLLLTQVLSRKDIQLYVAVWNKDEVDYYSPRMITLGVGIIDLSNLNSIVEKWVKLIKFVHIHKIHIIQSYTFYLNVLVWSLSLFTQVKAVGTLRSSFAYSRSQNYLLSVLCGILPFRIISNNYSGANELLKFYRDLSSLTSVKVIWNACHVPTVESKIRNSEEFIVTCSIGSLIPVKRIDIIVDVIAELTRKGLMIKHYHIGDGLLLKKLQSHLKSKDLSEKNFQMVGNVEDVTPYLKKANIFIHTSKVEGCPNAIMEAMANGLAIISSNCGDSALLLGEGRGKICLRGSISEIVESIVHFAHNPKIMKEFGKKSHNFALEEFGLQRFGQEYMNYYYSLMKTS